MLNPTSLQALRATPDRTSPNSWDPLAQLGSIEILVTERSALHVVGELP